MPEKPPVACYLCDTQQLCAKHGTGVAEPKKNHKHCPLYDRARWKHPRNGLRVTKLRHSPLCADPYREGCHQPATDVHHVKDHHGNEFLFWDFNNLESLCHSCHSRITGESHGIDGKNIEKIPVLVDGKINGRSQV